MPTRSSSRACGPKAKPMRQPADQQHQARRHAGALPRSRIGRPDRQVGTRRRGVDRGAGTAAGIALAHAGHVPATRKSSRLTPASASQPARRLPASWANGTPVAISRQPGACPISIARSVPSPDSTGDGSVLAARHRVLEGAQLRARRGAPRLGHHPLPRCGARASGARSVSLHPRAAGRPAAGRRRSPAGGRDARRRGPVRPAPAHRSERRARHTGASTGSSATGTSAEPPSSPGHGQVLRRHGSDVGLDIGCERAGRVQRVGHVFAGQLQPAHPLRRTRRREGDSSSRLKAARRTPFSPCWAEARSTSYQLSPITVGAVSPRSRSQAPKAATRAGMAAAAASSLSPKTAQPGNSAA